MYTDHRHYVTCVFLFEFHLHMSEQSTYVLEWFERERMGLPNHFTWRMTCA